ncbi:DNA-binding transcriptional LysR family regulator [Allocatelliglobosispora scoriae]|uniref:DNA-binding transcriptional LysR family regulator n=1 Tax=Allocatelliglobosispora scoriae TaxID=643052 RepID=A0A841BYU1_9ACTN|nr:LysR family transcriptional regulator [Allocatelliglobosispora scoriae]MBB5873304.1 DNA-binding transcriptional LysR family regulator [Allocatelliglobosispora scoriae]
MRVELRHLRVVCAIAEAGSVTKAAAQLGLAAPALTTQLQRIERTFGGQLFHRERTGVRPTELGELVLARARVLLPAAQGLEEEATRFASALSQRDATTSYRIGAVNGPLIGGLVSRLAATHPAARLTTHPSWSTTELASMLLDDKLDYAIVGACGEATPPLAGQLTWHLVASAPVFVLLSEDHPAAGVEEISLADLADAQWAATPGDGCFSDCFAAACARSGFTPQPILETDIGGCIDLVRSGDAVALCQPTFRESSGVVVVPLAGSPLHWRHLLGWRPDSPAARSAETVVSLAAEVYDAAVSRSTAYRRWLATR